MLSSLATPAPRYWFRLWPLPVHGMAPFKSAPRRRRIIGVRNQGSSTLHDGTFTLTKNLDVPRIGPPLDADDTPRRDRLVVEYNTHKNPMEDGVVRDTSGRELDGVFYGGASYSAADKAFSFTGTNGSNIRL